VIVRILYFASLKDRVGASEETLDVPETSDVASLWEALERRHPRLREVDGAPAVACDMVYAAWDRKLRGVVGGRVLAPGQRGVRVIRLQDRPIDVSALAAEARRDGDGAVSLFLGPSATSTPDGACSFSSTKRTAPWRSARSSGSQRRRSKDSA